MKVSTLSAGVLLACLAAIALQVFYFSPISPDPLHIPSAPAALETNKELQKVIKLGEGVINGPEDLFVSDDGLLYTVTRDGWIKRMKIHDGDGSWENWKKIDSPAGLGITPSKDGGLLIADGLLGLVKVTDADGFTVLANSSIVSFAEELVESSLDGCVYVTVPSTKYGYHNWYHDILEAKPNGQILKYDPSTKETTVLLDNLCFPNGIALPKNEDYLVFCETWKFRCQKYWLTGEKKGLTEIFVENLPGGPDNIHLAPDGSFWIGLIQVVSEAHGFLHRSKLLKHLVVRFPKIVEFLVGVVFRNARVVNVGGDGRIIRMLEDPEGKVINFVTTAFEYEGHLYMGGLATNFVGKLPLSRT